MKILHVIRSSNPAGGGPIEGIRQLSGVVKRLGHTVEVFCLDDPASPWIGKFPVPIHALGPSVGGYGYSSKAVPWMRENARRFDVAVVNGLWQYHGVVATRVLASAGIPYVVFPHGMLDPYFKQRYPLKHLKKFAYWQLQERHLLRNAAAVLFTCEEERRLAPQTFWPYQVNGKVVQYGTSTPQGDAEAQVRLFHERFPGLAEKEIYLFLSRLHPKKGCDLLVKAFAAEMKDNPKAHLVIAGPDEIGMQRDLNQLATSLGIEGRVTWTGMIQGDLKYGALRSAEVFVLPSHQENFGIVVAESLACGTPVLISDKVNIWQEVVKEGAGIVAPDDLKGTQELLRTWQAMPEVQKQAMKQQAQTTFLNNFEIGGAGRSLLNILEGAVAGTIARA